jgi:hypothetical protein
MPKEDFPDCSDEGDTSQELAVPSNSVQSNRQRPNDYVAAVNPFVAQGLRRSAQNVCQCQPQARLSRDDPIPFPSTKDEKPADR